MKQEPHELEEHAQEARLDSSLAPVSVTMAILAVLVAAVSLLGHRAHTEELLQQTKATDHWAYYQAKSIRRHTYQLFLDLLSVTAQDNERAAQVKEKYQGEISRYKQEQEKIEEDAREFEKETDRARREADRFDLGEGFLEAGLVIASVTLLTKRRLYWVMGIALGLAGLGVASTGLLVR
ncbi:MAG TPA: DUF4337 domain-containing protein [Candidatus Acidoferrales bacterium]|jgi:hypothetical protein|nr:DUF4337 domain-containing protein [Candidatus Acidoferrales bacterium]